MIGPGVNAEPFVQYGGAAVKSICERKIASFYEPRTFEPHGLFPWSFLIEQLHQLGNLSGLSIERAGKLVPAPFIKTNRPRIVKRIFVGSASGVKHTNSLVDL